MYRFERIAVIDFDEVSLLMNGLYVAGSYWEENKEYAINSFRDIRMPIFPQNPRQR